MWSSTLNRALLILAIAIGAHLIVLMIRGAGRRALALRLRSRIKIHAFTGFFSSAAIFAVYAMAAGFVLREVGISLTAYLASLSVIGLALSFGSQGLVQDVIAGLTLLFSDLVDVGDMVEISGQIGIVDRIDIRFTVLTGCTGSQVAIPNRTITNVITYPLGYLPAFVDVRLPDEARAAETAHGDVKRLLEACHEQFPHLMRQPPLIVGREITASGAYVRIKFGLWPSQGGFLDSVVRPAFAQAMRKYQPDYADWMVAIHYGPDTGEPKERPKSMLVARGRADRGARVPARRG